MENNLPKEIIDRIEQESQLMATQTIIGPGKPYANIVAEIYEKAVTPYAEREYLAERLIEQLKKEAEEWRKLCEDYNQQNDKLLKMLKESNQLFSKANDLAEKIINEIK